MGRRSSVSRLPKPLREELDRLIREGQHTIDEILAHLQQLGAPLKRTAVADYRRRMERQLEHVRQAQEVAGAAVAKLGEAGQGDVGRLVAELLKTLAFQILADREEGDAPDLKEVYLLSRAIKDLESASKASADRELKIRRELAAEAKKRLDAIERDPAVAQDPKAILARVRAIYGLTDDEAA